MKNKIIIQNVYYPNIDKTITKAEIYKEKEMPLDYIIGMQDGKETVFLEEDCNWDTQKLFKIEMENVFNEIIPFLNEYFKNKELSIYNKNKKNEMEVVAYILGDEDDDYLGINVLLDALFTIFNLPLNKTDEKVLEFMLIIKENLKNIKKEKKLLTKT